MSSSTAEGAVPPSPMPVLSTPAWINEDHLIDVLEEHVEGFKKINKFEVGPAAGPGENYQSLVLRIKINVELKDGSAKDVSFMIKTVPPTEEGAMMSAMMGVFPKETLVYNKYLPIFEKLYQDVGKNVSFGPKAYTLKKNPGVEYVLLEDLCPSDFKNLNRIQGLDKEHTMAALKKLAELHAVSAVQYETNGEYDAPLTTNIFNEQTAGMFKAMLMPSLNAFLRSLAKYEIGAKYVEKAKVMIANMMDTIVELIKVDPEEFNVLSHGDLWSNNIMFRHNSEGKIEETKFVDFQLTRYGTPVHDLYYFLLTSPKIELKTANFDEFVQYYHDNVVENLKILNYPKKLPTLKGLQIALLKKSALGFQTLTNTCAGILLDPTECIDMQEFFKEGDAADKLKEALYDNPRYVKHMEVLLPWMDSRGLLDL